MTQGSPWKFNKVVIAPPLTPAERESYGLHTTDVLERFGMYVHLQSGLIVVHCLGNKSFSIRYSRHDLGLVLRLGLSLFAHDTSIEDLENEWVTLSGQTGVFFPLQVDPAAFNAELKYPLPLLAVNKGAIDAATRESFSKDAEFWKAFDEAPKSFAFQTLYTFSSNPISIFVQDAGTAPAPTPAPAPVPAPKRTMMMVLEELSDDETRSKRERKPSRRFNSETPTSPAEPISARAARAKRNAEEEYVPDVSKEAKFKSSATETFRPIYKESRSAFDKASLMFSWRSFPNTSFPAELVRRTYNQLLRDVNVILEISFPKLYNHKYMPDYERMFAPESMSYYQDNAARINKDKYDLLSANADLTGINSIREGSESFAVEIHNILATRIFLLMSFGGFFAPSAKELDTMNWEYATSQHYVADTLVITGPVGSNCVGVVPEKAKNAVLFWLFVIKPAVLHHYTAREQSAEVAIYRNHFFARDNEWKRNLFLYHCSTVLRRYHKWKLSNIENLSLSFANLLVSNIADAFLPATGEVVLPEPFASTIPGAAELIVRSRHLQSIWESEAPLQSFVSDDVQSTDEDEVEIEAKEKIKEEVKEKIKGEAKEAKEEGEEKKGKGETKETEEEAEANETKEEAKAKEGAEAKEGSESREEVKEEVEEVKEEAKEEVNVVTEMKKEGI